MSLPFDPNDPAVHRWFVELNVALDDMRAVFDDMCRKKSERDLGPRQHVDIFDGGWDKTMSLLGRTPPKPSAPAATDVMH
jgi:hypothetical protein